MTVRDDDETMSADRRQWVLRALGAAVGVGALAGCERAGYARGDAEGARAPLLGVPTVTWVDTLEDLRTIVGTAEEAVVVMKGHTVPGDGGGGVFYWDAADQTSADNEGTIVVPDAPRVGCWKRMVDGPWSVRWFGAKGDGTTDDTGAFHAAMEAMTDAKGMLLPPGSAAPAGQFTPSAGNKLVVPPGVYLIGDVRIQRSIWLEGFATAGWEPATILRVLPGHNGLVVEDFATSSTLPPTSGRWTIISNLCIRGANAATLDGIVVKAHAVKVQNCFIQTMGRNGITIRNDWDSRTDVAVPSINCNNWQIENCTINTCGLDTSRPEAERCGLYVNGADANAGLCTGTDFHQCGAWGVLDSSFLGNAYVGCHFAAPGGAFKLDDPNNASTFLGCYVEGGSDVSVVGNPTFVGGFATGAVSGLPTQRVGSARSRLYFVDDNHRGRFSVQLPEAGYGGGSAFTFRYDQFGDFHETPVIWGLKRVKISNDSLSEVNNASPHFNADYHLDRCWAFQWVNSGLTDAPTPFGWTDRAHPGGVGHPFFRRAFINQKAFFSLQSGVVPILPGATVIVSLPHTGWLRPDAEESIAPSFAVRIDPSSPTPLADARVRVGGYQITDVSGAGRCDVAVTNDGTSTVRIVLVGAFGAFKKWWGVGSAY